MAGSIFLTNRDFSRNGSIALDEQIWHQKMKEDFQRAGPNLAFELINFKFELKYNKIRVIENISRKCQLWFCWCMNLLMLHNWMEKFRSTSFEQVCCITRPAEYLRPKLNSIFGPKGDYMPNFRPFLRYSPFGQKYWMKLGLGYLKFFGWPNVHYRTFYFEKE